MFLALIEKHTFSFLMRSPFFGLSCVSFSHRVLRQLQGYDIQCHAASGVLRLLHLFLSPEEMLLLCSLFFSLSYCLAAWLLRLPVCSRTVFTRRFRRSAEQ